MCAGILTTTILALAPSRPVLSLLGACLGAAQHRSLLQPHERLCASMELQGAHATLAAALPAASAADGGGDEVAPLCLGLLIRFLRSLPEPAFAFGSAAPSTIDVGLGRRPGLSRGGSLPSLAPPAAAG